MREFEVTVTETLEKKVTVEALSQDEAEQAVRDMWNESDIILDAEDFIDVSFKTDDGKELSAVPEKDTLDVLMRRISRLRHVTRAVHLRELDVFLYLSAPPLLHLFPRRQRNLLRIRKPLPHNAVFSVQRYPAQRPKLLFDLWFVCRLYLIRESQLYLWRVADLFRDSAPTIENLFRLRVQRI